MNTLGNLIWMIFGGIFVAIEYFISSFLLMITIVGIPFGLQTLKLGMLALWPFGQETRQTREATGCLYTFMNVFWLVFGGIWICLTHVVFGVLLAITIIGLPFARQHIKLAALSLTPFGREIYTIE